MNRKLFIISRIMFVLGIVMTLVLNLFRDTVGDFHYGLLFGIQLVLLIGSAVIGFSSRKKSN